MRLGLALSGGGLRATLFHLGAVRALHERGALEDVTHITSVSGGSILAAHLVKNWTRYRDPATFAGAAQEIVAFARRDVRGRIFRRLLLPPYYLLPYMDNLRRLPPRLRREGTVRNLLFERHLQELLGRGTLDELVAANPDAPQLDILSTNLTRGSLAYFNGQTFVPNDDQATPIPARMTVARAVLASALFPAVFPTIELNAENLLAEPPSAFPQSEYFTDGGVYDNLGIRRFQTVLRGENCPVDNVLVCDASGAFDWLIERETLGYWKTALRSTDILMKRLADLEYEIARATPNRFCFARISDVIEPAADNDLPTHVQRQIKNVRTDLDRFSITEINTIVLHGYSVAARKLDELYPKRETTAPQWLPFPKVKRPPDDKTIRQLQRSRFHSTNLFRWNDAVSYVYPLLLLVMCAWGWRWYDGGRFDRYYDKLAAGEREIAGRVNDPQAAIDEIQRAIVEDSLAPDTRLRVAMLAYTLFNARQAPEALLDKTLARLAKPERARFESARWTHYYGGLDKETFGTPTIENVAQALRSVRNALPHLAPDAQVEAILTTYGAYRKLTRDHEDITALRDVFSLWDSALSHLEQPDAVSNLSDLNRFRVRLLRGHYFLEKGNQTTDRVRDAEDWYRRAAQTYGDAKTMSPVGDYWKVEFNSCNALRAAAGAARKYRDKNMAAMGEERQNVTAVIDETLAKALSGCRKAQELAPSRFWQPYYVAGLILLEKTDVAAATPMFYRGFRAAMIAHEETLFRDTFLRNVEPAETTALCRNRDFSSIAVSICRR